MDGHNLLFYSCIKIKNDIWFSAIAYNGLYRYDMEKKCTERVARFPNEENLLDTLYSKICLYHNLLVFIPCNANKIAIFNIDKREFQQFDIPYACAVKEYNAIFPNFLEGVIFNDSLYIIGWAKPVIIKMNLKSYEFEMVYEIPGAKGVSNEYFGVQVTVEKNLLYIPCCYQNSVLIYDMECDEVSWVKIGKSVNRYFRVVNDGQNFYFTARNSEHIVFWNKNRNACEEICISFQKSYGDAMICLTKKFVWTLSSGEIYQISKSSNKICRYINMGNHFWIDYVAPYQEGICFVNSISGDWYYVDDKGVVENLEIKIKEPHIGEVLEEFVKRNVCVHENLYLSMRDFMYAILHDKNSMLSQNEISVFPGNKIWNEICEGNVIFK